MGYLWDLIQSHLDTFGVRDAAFARRLGVSPQTLNSMKKRGLKRLPERALLDAIASAIGKPYGMVLDAALIDTGYLDDARVPVAHADPSLDAIIGTVARRSPELLPDLLAVIQGSTESYRRGPGRIEDMPGHPERRVGIVAEAAHESRRVDVVLAARDQDDDDEAEAQQEEP